MLYFVSNLLFYHIFIRLLLIKKITICNLDIQKQLNRFFKINHPKSNRTAYNFIFGSDEFLPHSRSKPDREHP